MVAYMLVFEPWVSLKINESKGQFISKCPYEMTVSAKIPTKCFPGVLP